MEEVVDSVQLVVLCAALVMAEVGGPELDTDKAVLEFYLAPLGW